MGNEQRFERVSLVVNAASRSGASAYDHASQRLRDLGVEITERYPVTDASRIAEVVEHAIERSDLVIVGGGDGTLSSVVDEFAHRDVTLGVLPLGTANDLARTLQIPTELEGACQAIADGKVVDTDLGKVGDNYFVNVASVGLSVAVTQVLTSTMKQWLGPMAYPLAALRAYRGYVPFTAWLDFPDDDHQQVRCDNVLQLAVGNGRHYGGGNAVSPTASIDDHSLDIHVIKRGRAWDQIQVARSLRDGSFVRRRDVLHLTTRAISVRTSQEQPVNVDGEVVATTPQKIMVEQNALKVLIPATSTAARRDASSAA